MGKRFGKALQALALILLITVACFAFMPWKMCDVIENLDDVERCMILRYDQSYSTAYPQDGELQGFVTTLQGAIGHFDRNRNHLMYWGDAPLYRIYFWSEEGRIPDVWLCGTAIFYEGAQYILNDDVAEQLNQILASCFS